MTQQTIAQQTITRTGRPRSVHFQAVQKAIRIYRVDARRGLIFNSEGRQIGGNTYEPRVTIHLDGKKKFNARVNKIVGFVKFGPEALRRGVSVIHKDGNKFNNRASNLELRYNAAARKAVARLVA
jgi:hypothetical protein